MVRFSLSFSIRLSLTILYLSVSDSILLSSSLSLKK